MHAIVFAVKSPEHDPAPGHAMPSRLRMSSRDPPTASNTEIRSSSRSPTKPGSIGPPVTAIAGRSRRPAAIRCPGTILSQDGISTIPSNACARTMISIESAISSLDGIGYLMPSWFIAMPSHIPMVLNSNGTPPAIRMPAFTASLILSR